jgi:hypothetical protein
MYTGRMIEDLIATVERAERLYPSVATAEMPGALRWSGVEAAEILKDEDLEMPLACLLEQSYGEHLVEVA